MKKKTKNTILFLILFGILIVVILFLSKQVKDKPFNPVVLDNSTTMINNFTEFEYYDTVIHVGLEELGLKNIVINISTLSEEAQENFRSQGGQDLAAHIRERNGYYYLFISPNNRLQQIRVISHELIHLQQYHSKDLIYKNDTVIWKNDLYILSNKQYSERPWEDDAYQREGDLEKKIKNTLYSE